MTEIGTDSDSDAASGTTPAAHPERSLGPRSTTIANTSKGFDFLGYHLWPDRIMVAQATVERFLARVTRLYEQEQGRPLRSAPLGSYVRRWVGWVRGGVGFIARYGCGPREQTTSSATGVV